jgi:precorrin-6B methylase 2
MGIVMGKVTSKAIGVAAELDVADHLSQGPRPVAELAAACDANADALGRMLRTLAAVGIFSEVGPGVFANSPGSEALRSDVPGSMRAMAMWFGHELHWRIWNELGHSVRTGEIATKELFGTDDVFEVLDDHSDAHQVFNEAMTGLTSMTGRALVDGYDFSPYRHIVDVGGGHGSLALMISDACPEAKVTLYDLPHVVEGAREILTASGRVGQIDTVGGSFFDGVPGPADAYVMKAIIHDWPDERCQEILGHCRDNLNDDGRVIVCEMLITDGPESIPAKMLDLEMLVGPGGRERTESQFADLFASAGLELTRVVATSGPVVALEARRA